MIERLFTQTYANLQNSLISLSFFCVVDFCWFLLISVDFLLIFAEFRRVSLRFVAFRWDEIMLSGQKLYWSYGTAVTSESLVSREFSRFVLEFHFSILISKHFHFTFHSRSQSQCIFISLFILKKSELDFHFTFHFSDKVKEIFLSLFTSRKEWIRFLFHFSLLGKSERD